jgi:hypothetical protein
LSGDSTVLTLLSAPGYPECADELLALNVDRKETAFCVLDTPFRLAPNGVTAWQAGTNAVENGEDGLITSTSQAAVYYPSGLSTNTDGTSVVVPASHMALRTIAYNDSVAYPWFAPAGLTRGGITNATNVGYIDSEGEFVPTALNQGQRDTLYLSKVNPITNFPGQGLFVYGQKTLYAAVKHKVFCPYTNNPCPGKFVIGLTFDRYKVSRCPWLSAVGTNSPSLSM